MRVALIEFPGSNCDRDLAVAFRQAGANVDPVWHKETTLPAGTDLVALPGGFAWGDYLRCGAMAARAPIMASVREHAERGGFVLGICNGFQILLEGGFLPGALMRNSGIRFICRTVDLEIGTTDSAFTSGYSPTARLRVPVAHHDGNYVTTDDGLRRLRDEDLVAFRYASDINGSVDRIAGVLSPNRRVLGLMPHPERAVDAALGSSDGLPLFRSAVEALVVAS